MRNAARPGPDIFLLTRFSIRPDSELEEFLPGNVLPAFKNVQWLDQRLRTMVLYTIPSIEAQTDKAFRWLVGADRDTPSSILRRLEDVLPAVSQLVFSDDEVSFNDRVREILREHGPAVSIRLDSDDALGQDFVSRVRLAKLRAGDALNFPHGMALYETSGLLVHKLLHSNPFIAYFGPRSGDHGLQLGVHSQIQSLVTVRNVTTFRPMWLKVYGSTATSKAPPNGFPVFGKPARALQRLAPKVGLHIPQVSVRSKIISAAGFFGRSIAKRLPAVDVIYLLLWPRSSAKKMQGSSRYD